jgi:hypothetical protein
LAFRPFKKQPELFLGQAVHALHFLLFPKLYPIVGYFSTTAFTMLAWRVCASVKRALVRIAAIAFKK